MEFGIKKCGVLVLKRGKIAKIEGIVLPDGQVMKEIDDNGYKYLGILEAEHLKESVDSPLCRLCGEKGETINHIISECNKLAQKEYKRRHDNIARLRLVHWKLCCKYGIDRSEKWYEHQPERVVENESFKILWDMYIQCDHKTRHCCCRKGK